MIGGVARRFSSPTFIGRDQERAVVTGHLADPRPDLARAVVIGGEAGVGKTRLIDEVAATAVSRGWRVLVGHCLELGEEGLPFAPIVEALRDLPQEVQGEALEQIIGPARAEIGGLVPSLADPSVVRRLDRPSIDRSPDDAAQARLFEAILGLVTRLAAVDPLLLVVEDLHWADRSTRDLWRFLVRNLRRGPVLLVATFRTDELHRRHPLVPFLAELGRSASVDRLDLPRFGRDEMRGQLSAILGHPAPADLTGRIFERSDGNPFFAEELLAAEPSATRSMGTPAVISTDLQAVLVERISRLTEATQSVLRVAAIVGRDVPHELLAWIADLSEAGLVEALHEAIEQQVLVLDPTSPVARYRFRHALIQEAVYGELLPTERARLHRRIADALLGGATSDVVPAGLAAEIAHHADRSNDAPRALHWAIAAGDTAMAVAAFAEAYAHFEGGLRHWSMVGEPETVAGISRAELLARAASAAAAAGDLIRAAGLAREAIELAADAGDPEWQAVLEDRRFWYLWESGDLDGAATAIERANDDLTAILPPASRVRILTDLAQARLLQARYAEAATLAVEAHRQAGSTGDARDAGLALMIWGNALCALGRLDEGIARGREAIELLDTAGDESVPLAVQTLAVGLYWAGRHRESVDMLLARYDRLRHDGLERRYGVALLSSLWDSLTDLGRWDEADRLAAEAAFPDGENRSTAWFRECVAELEILRGNVDRARSEIEIAERVVGPGASALDRIFMLRSVAGIARAEGRHADVRQAIDEAIGQSSDPERDTPLWWLFAFAARSEADRAEIARARGPRSAADAEDALAYVERMSSRLARIAAIAVDEGWPAPTLTAYRLHAAAEASRAAGRAEPARWAATAEAWAGLEQPIDEAYARYREAEALLASGDRPAAAARARVAYSVAARIGAAPLRTDIEALARRARISLEVEPSPTATTDAATRDPWGLTERERDVLALLGAGRTNREIGQALFITEKTASVHVSNILGKLGVSRRGAAAAIAARLGLIAPEPPA